MKVQPRTHTSEVRYRHPPRPKTLRARGGLTLAFCLVAACTTSPSASRVTLPHAGNEFLVPRNAFCSLVGLGDSIWTDTGEVLFHALLRDGYEGGVSFTVSPPVGSVAKAGDNGDLHVLTLDPERLAVVDEFKVTWFGDSDGLTVYEMREEGLYLERNVRVIPPDGLTTYEDQIRAQVFEAWEAGAQQIRILPGAVRVSEGNSDAVLKILYTGDSSDPIDELLDYQIEPNVIHDLAVGENFLELTIPKANLEGWATLTVDAFLLAPSGATLADMISAGEYMVRDIELVTDPLPSVRLDLLDLTTSERLFGQTFSEEFYACSVNVVNPSDDKLIVYGTSVNAIVSLEVEGFNPWQERYRPLSFASILEGMNDIRRNSPEQKLISLLEFTGELATGAAVFVTGPDYGEGVALFTGIFTPELRARLLEDILANVSSIQVLGMNEVEEIAPQSQVTKYVFFPKGLILGVVGGGRTAKITEILNQDLNLGGYRIQRATTLPETE